MRIPRATYRLQFTPHFGFDQAAEILDYLRALGISDIYASPIFMARPGSMHGYDVIDPLRINPELGGEEGFERLAALVKAKDLGWLQDIVPNHMAYDSGNQILMDVLENGPYSQYLPYFDIQLTMAYENLKNKLLAPFLGDFYGHCLDQNQIQAHYSEKGFSIGYFNWIFPLNLSSYLNLLLRNLDGLGHTMGEGHGDWLKFLEITQMLKDLAAVQAPQERSRISWLVKSKLWQLYESNGDIKAHIDGILTAINHSGTGQTDKDMDRLLANQFFRLAFWKVGNEELNYRRFFTVNGLIGMRAEYPKAFDYMHQLVFRLVAEGKFTGLRIDHLDGLYDPRAYVQDLRGHVGSLFVTVEKILDMHESLDPRLDVQGTTGYDFLNFVNGVLVARSNAKKMGRAFVLLAGQETPYARLVFDKKQMLIGKQMAGDIDNLAHLLKRLINRNPYGRDLTMYGLRRALVEVMAQFPVYRTYVNGDGLQESDQVYLKEALARAYNNNPAMAYELDAIEKVLLLKFEADIKPHDRETWLHFVKRFQQFTGPLMAKSMEDTVFYVYNRLISLNEVGGNPDLFGVKPQDFHDFNRRRKDRWPQTLNATATHDTKRGEDVRCRINVLSELPAEWTQAAKAWNRHNRPKKKFLRRMPAPNRDDEYFIYQTLIGALPWLAGDMESFRGRMAEYIVKAVREAKVHTAWIKPDQEYEDHCVAFVGALLDDQGFLEQFLAFQKRIAWLGMFNSLSQQLLKITSPGVPDFYQGSELWDLFLVDPDNRRPVDYGQRQKALASLQVSGTQAVAVLIKELWRDHTDGRIKMFTIHRGLLIRADNRELFEKGEYIPLEVQGAGRRQVLAFARRYEGRWAVTMVPRLLAGLIGEGQLPLGGLWQDTAVVLPPGAPGQWTNGVTQQTISAKGLLMAAEAFQTFPGALLI